MTKLRKAKNTSLVEDVTRQIEGAITSGEYRPGDKLPSTRELQEIFGASLGTIRESLAILEQKHLLEVRKGAKGGFFVRKMTTQPMTESLELLMRHMAISHRELYDFRANLEAGLVRLAVQRATPEDMDVFDDYLARFEGCLGRGNEGWVELVKTEQGLRREFLRVIQNRVYEAVLMPINRHLLHYAGRYLPGDNEETRAAYDYWVEIIAAIKERDEDRASSLVKSLLYRFLDLIHSHQN